MANGSSAIGIAGSGRVAQALGRLLRDRGAPVAAVAGRNPQHAAAAARFMGVEAVSLGGLPSVCGRILIAVSDDVVPAIAAELPMKAGLALHTCGARGPEALSALAARGVACGVLHPLQTIASPEQGLAALPGSFFAVSGDTPAVEWALEIVQLAGGTPLRIAPGRMPVYHAAAVMAANDVIGLIDAAAMLMVSAGLDAGTAVRALAPLIRAGVENAIALGPEQALTGPVQRGDADTVRRHLEALAGAPRSAAELYRAAGLHVLELARRRGLGEKPAVEIEDLLRRGIYG